MALWKEIAGYEGLYLISDEGDVISLPRTIKGRNANGEMVVHRRKKKIKSHLRGKGKQLYPAVTLTKDGVSKAYVFCTQACSQGIYSKSKRSS